MAGGKRIDRTTHEPLRCSITGQRRHDLHRGVQRGHFEVLGGVATGEHGDVV